MKESNYCQSTVVVFVVVLLFLLDKVYNREDNHLNCNSSEEM